MTLPAQALRGLECCVFFLYINIVVLKLHTISVAFHYLIMNEKKTFLILLYPITTPTDDVRDCMII